MKKRIVQTFLAAILVSILAVKPVLATPSVDDMQTDKEQTQNEVSALQRQLVENLEKISGLEEQIGQKEDEISQASVDLEEAINKQNKQYDAMKLRIKYMYEAGNMDALETFLSAESFSELVNQAEYIQNIHSYDRQKLNEYISTKEEIEDLKEGLQEETENLQQAEADLAAEREALNTTIASKQSEIAQLDQNIQDALAQQQAAAEAAAAEAARQAALQAAVVQASAQDNNTAANTGTANSAVSTTNNTNTGNAGENTNSGDSSNSGTGSNEESSGSGNTAYVPPQGTDGWAVVEYARQFLGNPYVYGGNSLTEGTDCSGFTQQIYAAFGVSLGRSDSAQATAGVEIPLSEARAGDLLVYWGHVGIYNGSGGIIHASSPSVGIVEWPDCQYRELRCVRRVL